MCFTQKIRNSKQAPIKFDRYITILQLSCSWNATCVYGCALRSNDVPAYQHPARNHRLEGIIAFNVQSRCRAGLSVPSANYEDGNVEDKREREREVGPGRLGPFLNAGDAATARAFPWDPPPRHSAAMHKRAGIVRGER